MKTLFLIITAITLYTSCSKTEETFDGSLVINTSAIFSDGVKGTIVIRGFNNDDSFQEIIPSTQGNFEVSLPNGEWNIYTVAWFNDNGGINLNGKIRCSVNKISVDGNSFQVDINLSKNNCLKNVFSLSATPVNTDLQFKPVQLQPCLSFNRVSFTGDCLAEEKKRGFHDTFRIGLNSYNTINQSFEVEYLSGCINPENGETIGLPFAEGKPLFPFVIYAYEDENCNQTSNGSGKIDTVYYVGNQKLQDNLIPAVDYSYINDGGPQYLYFADNIVGSGMNPLYNALPINRYDCNNGSGSHCLEASVSFNTSQHSIENVYKSYAQIFGRADNVMYYNNDGHDEGVIDEISFILGGPVGAVLGKHGITSCAQAVRKIGQAYTIKIPLSAQVYEVRLEAPTNPGNFSANSELRIELSELSRQGSMDSQIFEISCNNHNGYYASKNNNQDGQRLSLTEFHYIDSGSFNGSRYELLKYSKDASGIYRQFVSIQGNSGNKFKMYTAQNSSDNQGSLTTIEYQRTQVEGGSGLIELVVNSMDTGDRASFLSNSSANGDIVSSGIGLIYDDNEYDYTTNTSTTFSGTHTNYDIAFASSLSTNLDTYSANILSYDVISVIEHKFEELTP